MKFVQIIDFETERLDEMEQMLRAGRRFAGRSGGPRQRMLLKDRDNPLRYLALIEFDYLRGGHAQQQRPRDQQDG
ncbi:ABM domain-containing protein OS=Streptomyces violarus OX=67380 GN=FHS41_005987 PE=4 SV=1 [Streptomyces violarus]